MRPRAFSILLAALSIFFIYWTESSAYWRDSAEFIVAGTYLDVSHPAGFPLFGELANIFALIPIGPLAFRVNAFCSLVAALFLALTAKAALECVQVAAPKLNWKIAHACAFMPLIFLLGSATLLKRSVTAEMYLLDGALLAALFLMALRWYQSRDMRWLPSIAFCSGLTLGNHAPSGLVLAAAALIILVAARRTLRTAILPALIAGALGLAIYGYLPMRARALPPLTTGDPRHATGFFLEVTDGRDRTLRAGAPHNDLSVVSGVPEFAPLLKQIRNSANRLAREIHPFFLVAGICGLIVLIFFQPFAGFLLAAIAAGNWYFFLSWDPDPWMPTFFVAGVGAAVLCACAAERAKRFAAVIPLGCGIVGLLHSYNPDNLSLLRELRSYDGPVQTAAELLQSAQYGAPVIAEPSWFLLKFARDVEGVREDVPLLYQPALLFPGYFYAADLKLPSGLPLNYRELFSTEPQYGQVTQLITTLAGYRPLTLEGGLMNEFFAHVVQFESDGTLRLRKGMPSRYTPGFIEILTLRLIAALRTPLATLPSSAGDARHFTETKAVTTADLLARAGNTAQAATLIEGLCAPISGSKCATEALNNLGTYRMRLGDLDDAEKIFTALLERGEKPGGAVDQNLHAVREKKRAAGG